MVLSMNLNRLHILVTIGVLALWGNVIYTTHLHSQIYSNFAQIIGTLKFVNQPSQFDLALQKVKQELPIIGTVGYMATVANSDIFYDVQASSDYYQTQYALVPLVVDNSLSHNLVVGFFSTPVSSEEVLKRFKEKVAVKDFGNGVMLIKKEN